MSWKCLKCNSEIMDFIVSPFCKICGTKLSYVEHKELAGKTKETANEKLVSVPWEKKTLKQKAGTTLLIVTGVSFVLFFVFMIVGAVAGEGDAHRDIFKYVSIISLFICSLGLLLLYFSVYSFQEILNHILRPMGTGRFWGYTAFGSFTISRGIANIIPAFSDFLMYFSGICIVLAILMTLRVRGKW